MRHAQGNKPELTAGELLDAVPDAMYVLDGEWRFTRVNDLAAALLRRPAADLLGRGFWEAFPDAVGTPFEEHYRRAMTTRHPERFTAYDEPLDLWLSVRSVPVGDGLANFLTDVTELKRSEARATAFAEVQAVLRRVATAVAAEATTDAVHAVVCRETARLVDAHSTWLIRFTGPSRHHVLGAYAADPRVDPPAPDEEQEVLAGSEIERVQLTGLPVSVADRAGGRFAGFGLPAVVVVPIRLAGSTWGALAVAWDRPRPDVDEIQAWLVDLAELVSLALGNAEARAELARRAATDPLTGLANLRTLHDTTDRALSRGRRHDHPLTLALVDVDHFKAVNDGSGHLIGDRVLVTVAAELQRAVRAEDLVARAGGDEFAVLLDGGDAAAAKAVMDRVRAEIGTALVRRGLPEVTLSAGVCEWEPGMSREGLRRRADDALHWAKTSGRDGAWVHDPELMEVIPDFHSAGGRREPGAGDVVGAAEVQRSLRSARAFWQSTVDALPQRIAVMLETGEVVAVNEAWRRDAHLVGGVGSNHFDVPMDAEAGEALRAVASGDREWAEIERPLGGRWWRMRAHRFGSGRPHRVVVHHEDITERRDAERQARFRAGLLDEVDAAVVATGMDGRITAVNRAAERLFGWRGEEVHGEPMRDVVAFEDRPALDAMNAEFERRGTADAELVAHTRDGARVPIYTRHALMLSPAGRPSARVAVTVDVSERHRYQRDLEAARDYLGAVTSSMGDGLLVIAADGRIALANAAAAELLGYAPRELPGRPAEALLLGEPGRLFDATRAEDDEFLRADGTRMPVTWTRSPLSGPHQEGEHVLVFHDASERRARELRLRREAEGLRWAERIRRALEEDRFELHGQPIVDVADRRVRHHELLLRLREPDGSLVAPEAFLPAAEEHELMRGLDSWVLRRAVEVAAGGRPVHVNLSAQSVGDPAVIEALAQALRAAGVDPGLIVVEVTETALMRPGVDSAGFLGRFREIGCRVALDDFGIGYSGLARVVDAPMDALKIDRSFVAGLLEDPAKESVVRAVLSLARDLGAACVAEGVEDEATLERLRELGVEQAQGFLLGRPAPLEG